ncbi:hypothetical protein GH714_009902 [Hevea brasiliensis]|uniref:Uncharacterized protein n=1 Tax=Hevea brasiliensis TaxID=3981 RepID=A0A6A6M4B7_HEVBR|nr:hypothetical protein GH714_009902 [Hevea brasiliensis]
MATTSITELDDDTVRSMSIGAVFSDFVSFFFLFALYQRSLKRLGVIDLEFELDSSNIKLNFNFNGGKINSVDFHRKDDLLVTASEDDSVRLYDIASAKVVSLCMSPINDSFMSGSLDHSVRIWDLRVNACQGILRLRGRPTVAYDQQGLVFAVAMEGGAIKLFDSRSYDKRCGFSLEPSPNTTIEATFTPDGQYVVSGSGDGTLHAWNINMRNEVAFWNSHIGVSSCLKWAPRRAMFVAASSVLTFWIPNNSKSAAEPRSMENEGVEHIAQ